MLIELLWAHGAQAYIARELGVSEATISRDVKQIYGPVAATCPTCLTRHPLEHWQKMERQGRIRLHSP
jgi:hypothetical protein